MKNINGVEIFIGIPGNWPETLNEWFCCLLVDQPKARPPVSEQEWQSWLKFVEWHGMSSLIFTLLRSAEIDSQPPAEIYTALRQAYFANAARIMVRRSQLEVLVKQLEKEKIEPVVLKGCAFGEMIYSDVLQRPSADIDLLVRREDYERARTVLLENGYRSKRGDRSRHMSWSCDEEFMPNIQNEERQYVVELHWALTSNVQLLEKIEVEGLFGRAEEVAGLDYNYRVLHPVDALVYACLHLFYKHVNELRLIWLYDIHLLAEQVESRGLWHEAVSLSWEWQARLALKNCLELAGKWFNTKVPTLVSNLAHKPATFEEVQLFNLAAFQFEHDQRAGWLRNHLFQLRRLEGWDKYHYLKSRMFPSRQEIEANYPQLRVWPGPLVHIGRLAMMLVTKKS